MTTGNIFGIGIIMDEEIKESSEREYEVAALFVNELDEPVFGGDINIIQKDGPKLVALAYPIKKHRSAFLRVYLLQCTGVVAQELEMALNHDQKIIRHLLITPPIMTRRKDKHVEGEYEQESAKTAYVTPAHPTAVSNEALEEALEKILENEPK